MSVPDYPRHKIVERFRGQAWFTNGDRGDLVVGDCHHCIGVPADWDEATVPCGECDRIAGEAA